MWERIRRVPTWMLPLVLAAVGLSLPFLDTGFTVARQVQLALVLALIVSGINLSLGYAGQLSFGQAAMFAGGAYTAGVLAKNGVTDLLVQLIAAGIAALLVGLLTGFVGLRLGSWSLAMTSFFLVLLVPDVVEIFEPETGGRLGMPAIPPPTLIGLQLTEQHVYLAIVVVSVLWFAFFRNVAVSRHGIAFQVLKKSEVLSTSTGVSVFRLKLLGYVLGAIPAGLAGTLFANLDLFLTPSSFGLALTTSTLAAAILGGLVSVYGALVGAFVVQYASWQSSDFPEYAHIFYGAFLIVGGVVFGGGLAGLAGRVVARLDARWLPAGGAAPDEPREAVLAPIAGGALAVDSVSKAFGGNRALTDVSLRAEPGKVTALIGPNGSGKTTLLNLVCGYHAPDAGTVTLDGVEVQGRAAHVIAHRGVARTFQTPLMAPHVSAADTVAVGRFRADPVSVLGAAFRSRKYRRARARDVAESRRLLDLVGLGHLADREAASLPLGQRRLVEVARALAMQPQLLLLDEVASGLDEHEVRRLATLIGRIRDAGGTVLLVEHNFGLVLSLADHIYVLARGGLIAEGGPRAIEESADVRAQYLGETATTTGVR